MPSNDTIKTLPLPSGIKIPVLGQGTWTSWISTVCIGPWSSITWQRHR